VGAHYEKFAAQLATALESFGNKLLAGVAIQEAKHAEEAVIYGCFELARQHYEKRHA
jgi:hypothetical protein